MRQCPVKMLAIVVLLTGSPVLAASEGRFEGDNPYSSQVTSLPRPSRVVVTALGYIAPEDVRSLNPNDRAVDRNVPGFWPMQIGGQLVLHAREAERVWVLWRRLQPGNGAGCFSPGYLIEFYDQNLLLARASICFHCSNVGLAVDGGVYSIGGDAAALRRFERYVTSHLAPYRKPVTTDSLQRERPSGP